MLNVSLTGLDDFLKEGKENFLPILTSIVVLGIITIIVKVILKRAETYIISKTKCRAKSPGEYEKRINTLAGVFNKIVCFFIWAAGFTVLIARLGMSIAPVIAFAGIFGIAIGFGSQSLVKDIINGVFLLVENQIRMGDVASINGTRGIVETINWRTIVLRDLFGAVHVFPNGSVSSLSNQTKQWSAHVFDIGVAYREDVDVVISAIREVAEGLEKDEVYGEKIIEPVEIFGLDKFGHSAVVIKGRIKTLPRQQRTTGREFNRRIKKEFDRRGISIPFPHRRIYMGNPSGPLEVLMKDRE